jgi:uncharacterized damage-inducible protein DinB
MGKDNLVNYEMWALGRLLEAIEQTPAPRYKSQLLFAHILNAYRLWHDRIAGNEATTGPWDERSIEECHTMLAELERDFAALAEKRSPEQLAQIISYKNTKDTAYDNTLGDILQHLVLHSAYHRGQVNMLIRQAGGQPAMIDYIGFAREGKTS